MAQVQIPKKNEWARPNKKVSVCCLLVNSFLSIMYIAKCKKIARDQVEVKLTKSCAWYAICEEKEVRMICMERVPASESE